MYDDDILLMAPTITGLQYLLTVCERELVALDMQIIADKSMCIFDLDNVLTCSVLI